MVRQAPPLTVVCMFQAPPSVLGACPSGLLFELLLLHNIVLQHVSNVNVYL